jgi:hypothetical protein
MRKKWTKAARARAAEHGRRGGAMGNREGKRRGGQVSWHTKTLEEQEAIRAMLRKHVGKVKGTGANTSPKARAAQRVKGEIGMRKGLTSRKIAFLAESGMLRKVDLAPGDPRASVAPRLPTVPPAPAPVPRVAPTVNLGGSRPNREDYADGLEWLMAARAWDRVALARPEGYVYEGKGAK